MDLHVASAILAGRVVVHGVGDPRDDATGAGPRRDQPRAGLPRLPGARRGEGGAPPGAIAEDHNQYPITWGVPAFREAIAATYARDYGMTIDPETEICVTCGATEAMSRSVPRLAGSRRRGRGVRAVLRELRPGRDLVGGAPALREAPTARLGLRSGRAGGGVRAQTRAIVVGSPHNPTGKVFTRAELRRSRSSASRNDAIAITDEIYEHIIYDGAAHVRSHASGDGRTHRHDQRAVQDVRGTGWRVGWRSRPPPLMAGIRSTHDFLTVAAATPLQLAGRGRARAARRVLRAISAAIPRAARHHAARPARGGVRRRSARRRLLRHGRRVSLASTTTWRPRDTWSRRSGSPRCPGPRSSRSRPSARTCSASRSRRSSRRWRRPGNA